MKKGLGLILALFFCPFFIYAEGIVINEVVLSNQYGVQDSFGDTPDWIELFNNSDDKIDLDDYVLTDDADNKHKWVFPDIDMPAYSYLLIFASDRDIRNPKELHTNFKLSADDKLLLLFDNKGHEVSRMPLLELPSNASYGSYPDGSSDLMVFETPTPNSKNELSNVISFSHQGGFYTKPISLALESTFGDEIYYTVNGSEPTSQSNLYTTQISLAYKYDTPNCFSEIPTTPSEEFIGHKAWKHPDSNIDKAHIIRCAIFKNGERIGKIKTQTFFVDSAIVDKYDMPVISLVTDSLNLFGEEKGLYVPGKNFDEANPYWSGNYFATGEEWERPVHIEYYNHNGEVKFSQDAGIRLQGASTKMLSQKSLRLYAREEYGDKYFRHKLLPQKEFDKYQRFLLRTTMGAWNGNAVINDELAHEIIRDFDVEIQDYRPVVVFINGEYWGIHTIRDRIDEKYIAYTADVEADSVQMINPHNQEETALYEFIASHDLSDALNYNTVKTMLNINNVIEYYIAEMFFVNLDWPSNNFEVWTTTSSPTPWRHIFYDLDAGLYDYNRNMFEYATLNDSSVAWPNAPAATFMFRSLLKNKTFTNKFIKRYVLALENEFAPENTLKKLETLKALYTNEMTRHAARWQYPNDFERWEFEIDAVLVKFLTNRPDTVKQNLLQFFNLTEAEYQRIINTAADTNTMFVLAPNPNNGEFFIYNNSSNTLEGNIIITDITGKRIYSENNVNISIDEQKYFELPELSINTYILTFYGKGFAEHKKFIVIK